MYFPHEILGWWDWSVHIRQGMSISNGTEWNFKKNILCKSDKSMNILLWLYTHLLSPFISLKNFFEEVEDLKYALQQSAKLNQEYDKALRQTCGNFGAPFPLDSLPSRPKKTPSSASRKSSSRTKKKWKSEVSEILKKNTLKANSALIVFPQVLRPTT